MCGILGLVGQDIDERSAASALDQLTHRGPDHGDSWFDPKSGVWFGHRRLSIIDLRSIANQPMHSLDGNLVIVFNGEIYNHEELRTRLEQLGQRFASLSDTEVILNAYAEYGVECVHHFRGMFAFAIFDKQQQQLFMARDRFGIKPLYYSELSNGTFAFASELKALHPLPGFQRKISSASIIDYLKYRYVPGPDTIWSGVHKLSPGHHAVLNLRDHHLRLERYYSVFDRIQSAGDSSEAEVWERLKEAVDYRLVSDVEVGSFLSGGIDSSAVTMLASQQMAGIKAYSIGFESPGASELQFAGMVAKHLTIDHRSQTVAALPDDLWERLSFHYDEPLADSSVVPTFVLCQMVANDVKVALSGDGADEIFSGYSWYNRFLKKHHPLFSVLNRLGLARWLPGPAIASGSFDVDYSKILLDRFDDRLLRELLPPEILQDCPPESRQLFPRHLRGELVGARALQAVDIETFLVDDILTKVDRAGMAHSLEVRVPFLDHELVEAVLRLPERSFPASSTNKPVLRRLMRGKLPEVIIHRPKRGFSAPVTRWQNVSQAMKSFPESSRAVRDGLLSRSFTQRLVDRELANSDAMLWMLMTFENWYVRWAV